MKYIEIFHGNINIFIFETLGKNASKISWKSISESVRRMMSRMCEDSFLQNYSFWVLKENPSFMD